MNNKRKQVIKRMQNSDFSNALKLIEQLIDEGERDATIFYMAGQCSRYLNDIKTSIFYHEEAIKLNSENPSFQLALGIAYQLNEEYKEAHDVLSSLILNNQEWDDLDIAFNSLALTQKKMGLFDRAEKNYHQGIKIFLYKIMNSLSNSKNNEIMEIKPTTYNLWLEHVVETAIIFSRTLNDKIDSVAFPETADDNHQGLYWTIEKTDNKNVLLFLPNFLGTVRYYLTYDPSYFNLVGNIGSTLQELDNNLESKKYLTEANELMSEYQAIQNEF